MRYEFILAHEDKYPVKRMCNALGVGRSGYYYWRKSRPGQQEQANQELVEQNVHFQLQEDQHHLIAYYSFDQLYLKI